MKDYLRRGLAMLMSIVMTLSLFVGYLPTGAYAEDIVSNVYQAPVAALAANVEEIQMSISGGGKTLTYIGDTQQLEVGRFMHQIETRYGSMSVGFKDYSSYTTVWTIVDGDAYATVDGNGLVTAKNFNDKSNTHENTVTILAETTFYDRNGAVVGKGSQTTTMKVQFSVQDVYFYTRVPGVNTVDNTQDWYSLSTDVLGEIWGSTDPKARILKR